MATKLKDVLIVIEKYCNNSHLTGWELKKILISNEDDEKEDIYNKSDVRDVLNHEKIRGFVLFKGDKDRMFEIRSTRETEMDLHCYRAKWSSYYIWELSRS